MSELSYWVNELRTLLALDYPITGAECHRRDVRIYLARRAIADLMAY